MFLEYTRFNGKQHRHEQYYWNGPVIRVKDSDGRRLMKQWPGIFVECKELPNGKYERVNVPVAPPSKEAKVPDQTKLTIADTPEEVEQAKAPEDAVDVTPLPNLREK